MADEDTSVPVIAVTAAVGAIVLLLVLLCGLGNKANSERKQADSETEDENTKPKKQQQAKKQKLPHKNKKEARAAFTHPWLASSLKGHSGSVLGMDCSPNGKYLATCAEDRTVFLWSVKDFNQKEHKSVRANVELDHATQVKFSPDSKAFIVSLFNENSVRVFKIGKKPDGSAGNIQPVLDFPKKHTAEIINTGIASNGKFIMTCSKDTTMIVWDLKGEVLSTIDTHQVNNSYASVSPCGRFVASSGFTPDVKVWDVSFDKTGNFKEVTRAFELKGHSAGVHCFSFNNDSRRMATVSKDGTWKLWDTDINYQQNQDPYLLQSGQWTSSGPAMIALSPDARTVAITTGTTVSVYDAATTELDNTIEDVHQEHIKAVCFDNNNKYLLTTGDKHIHVFHNITGYKATIADLEQKRKEAKNQTLKDRLQQQLEESRSMYEDVLKS